MKYEPQPVDTTGIKLAEDIEDLTEDLAFHAHEVWAQQRIKDGWTLGLTRDDESKQHPCLIPYGDLSDTEKQYDRNAALETLKVILAMGYRIQPPNDRRARSRSEATALTSADGMLGQLRSAQQRARKTVSDGAKVELELNALLQVWNSRRDEDRAWWCQPELYRHLGRRFLKIGEAPLAREVAQTALELTEYDEQGEPDEIWNEDIELRQIFALALARSGSPDHAQRELLQLVKQGKVDEQTKGILGRTYKDQAIACCTDDAKRTSLLEKSLEHYRDAYSQFGGFWTGINVATIHRLLDHCDEAETVARKVRDECAADLAKQENDGATPEQTYWHLATLGEAALVLGDLKTAGELYRRAFEAAPKNFGDLNSTRRHARWLLEHWAVTGGVAHADVELLEQWLPISQVVVFTGHQIDQTDRPTPRFPNELRDSVAAAIRRWLDDKNALIGFSSAACGADLLFQKAIQDLGGESRIVLPYDIDQFKASNVSYAGTEWSELFDEVIDGATQLVISSPKRPQDDGIASDYANLILHGLASVRATELRSNGDKPVGLAVWNGQQGDRFGGTASTVKHWADLEMQIDQIDLSSDFDDGRESLPVVVNPAPPEIVGGDSDEVKSDTRIMAMLFGDAVNFSSLDEQQVARFIQHFMSPIAEIVREYGEANVVSNTWGDGLYLVFDHVREAGKCALDICDFTNEQIERKAWQTYCLPPKLNVRIALHAGPVFGCIDPITGLKNYTGTHVSRAARLEPKTPPGEVYASEAFAALCAEYKIDEFNCEYVKQLAWAKHYGSFPTFVLRRGKRVRES